MNVIYLNLRICGYIINDGQLSDYSTDFRQDTRKAHSESEPLTSLWAPALPLCRTGSTSPLGQVASVPIRGS
jgi:hypothetical protein